MQRMGQSFRISEPSSSESASIKTTLYKLIKMVNEEINSGEKQRVLLLVNHMHSFIKSFAKA